MCTLPCSHFYHVGCIDAWLRIKTTCPLDNIEIKKQGKGAERGVYGPVSGSETALLGLF